MRLRPRAATERRRSGSGAETGRGGSIGAAAGIRHGKQKKDGFAPIDKTKVALMASPDASPATLRLAEFCNTVQAKAA